MTERELYDYLMQCCDRGLGEADVLVCDKRENPSTDSLCVAGALRIEEKDGDITVVLLTG
jgi:hypothetical protein